MHLVSCKLSPVLLPDLMVFYLCSAVNCVLAADPLQSLGFPGWGAGRWAVSLSDSGAEVSTRGWNNFPVLLFAELAFSVNTSCFQDVSSIITKHDSILGAIAERV